MGSTLLTILGAITGLLVLAGVVVLIARRLRWFRAERATEQMRAIAEPRSGSAIFVRKGASEAALSAQAAIDRGAPRLRETSVAAWASRVIVLNAPVVNIGRSLDNDIVLPEDPVSADHCRLERLDSSFRLTDLGSRNKTYVNGRPVDDVVLRNGDQIRVGHTTFVFECSEERT
jgi:predicted component of type VI protein secretion system